MLNEEGERFQGPECEYFVFNLVVKI
jgi:hypothetical protein